MCATVEQRESSADLRQQLLTANKFLPSIWAPCQNESLAWHSFWLYTWLSWKKKKKHPASSIRPVYHGPQTCQHGSDSEGCQKVSYFANQSLSHLLGWKIQKHPRGTLTFCRPLMPVNFERRIRMRQLPHSWCPRVLSNTIWLLLSLSIGI